MDRILPGLLDNSGAFAAPELAPCLRSLTVDATRFGHDGPIVESADFAALLDLAGKHGARACLVQAYGHLITEEWHPDEGSEQRGLPAMAAWLQASGAFAAAGPQGGGWLVDLERWRAAGRPDPHRADLPALPARLARGLVYLQPESAPAMAELRRFLGAGIAGFAPADTSLPPAVRDYLARMRHLVTQLPRGVFVWNIESYADVEAPPEGFRGPLAALFGVAAGFKSNRLLETHGFDRSTRVTYVDYSAPGLEFRRLLLDWDGRDYPSFLRRLFRRLPSTDAHYLLWEGQTPETLDWLAVETRWRHELEVWGGAESLARHWQTYRRLPHQLVQLDLLGERGALRAGLRGLSRAEQARSAIWWSNAFFSLVSNWHRRADQRRHVFRAFLAELAADAPGLWLYGASSDNQALNAVQAAEAERFFRQNGGDELCPATLQRVALRF